jgi:hypothetical protein
VLSQSINLRWARLMQAAQKAGVGIEDIARALASENGETAAFDEARDSGNLVVSIYAHQAEFLAEYGRAQQA